VKKQFAEIETQIKTESGCRSQLEHLMKENNIVKKFKGGYDGTPCSKLVADDVRRSMFDILHHAPHQPQHLKDVAKHLEYLMRSLKPIRKIHKTCFGLNKQRQIEKASLSYDALEKKIHGYLIEKLPFIMPIVYMHCIKHAKEQLLRDGGFGGGQGLESFLIKIKRDVLQHVAGHFAEDDCDLLMLAMQLAQQPKVRCIQAT
jgi:hypothetical protein